MRKIHTALFISAVICIFAVIGRADSYSIGKTTLRGDILELDNLVIKAIGNASIVSTGTSSAIPAGTMRLESLKSAEIRVELTRDKKGEMTTKEAAATGGVSIKAKRADKETDANGKSVTIIRDVTATAKTATLVEGQETIALKGNVVVKITEPGQAEPIAVVTGENVMVFLKENRIRVVGGSDKPAELTYTPKEEDRK